jgi:hypothetical protein
MGAVSMPLVAWDLHNAGVILSMGMRWDTGAPILPYLAPEILLWFLNFPAHIVARPLANLLGLNDGKQHLLLFPFTLIWWWLVGLGFDRGLPARNVRRHWVLFPILTAVAALLLGAGLANSYSALRWWFQYGGGYWSPTSLIMVRFLTPTYWCVGLALSAFVAARRFKTQAANSR